MRCWGLVVSLAFFGVSVTPSLAKGVESGNLDDALSQPRPSYSTFRCTGVRWPQQTKPHSGRRSCKFTNICLDHTSNSIKYFVEPSLTEVPLFYRSDNGEPIFDFPQDFLSTGHTFIANQQYWAPEVVRGGIPSDAHYHSAPAVAYVSGNAFAGNFGHALFDFLSMAFNVLHWFDAYTPECQIMLAEQQGAKIEHDGFLNTTHPGRSVVSVLCKRPITSREQLASMAQGSLTCFEAFYTGTANLHTSITSILPEEMHRAAMMALELTHIEPRYKKPVITILRKKGRRTLENVDEIAAMLSEKLHHWEVQILEGEALESMSVRQQAQQMLQTSILITPCGGAGTILFFLQPSSTAIVLNYWGTTKGKSVQLEEHYYQNFNYLDLQYFPTLIEDYEGTSDRPDCEKKPEDAWYKEHGALINCNVRIKNLDRLAKMVIQAARRWAVEHAQPEVAEV